jgi:predicted 3-demethylubiquinone-9 3-methyltransferase (glyoxalase superfamily)
MSPDGSQPSRDAKETMMPTITPFLWFASEAEEASNLYVSIFPSGRVISVQRVQGRVLSTEFELQGQRFIALNGRQGNGFTDAVSFLVPCETQAEIDRYWDAFVAAGGAPGRCGWLKDRFGVSWQVVPRALSQMLGDADPARAHRVLQAMLEMQKLDVGRLRAAHEG